MIFVYPVLLSVHTKHAVFAIIIVFLGVDMLFVLFMFSEFINKNFEIDRFPVC
jgi:hypothetical protein